MLPGPHSYPSACRVHRAYSNTRYVRRLADRLNNPIMISTSISRLEFCQPRPPASGHLPSWLPASSCRTWVIQKSTAYEGDTAAGTPYGRIENCLRDPSRRAVHLNCLIDYCET